MNNFSFWQKWLFAVTILIIAFGLSMVFFNHTAVYDAIIDKLYEPIFWVNTDIPDSGRLFQQWAYGAWGATMAGWGVITAFIVKYPFRKKEKWAWSGLVTMLLVWFILDTSISLIYRVYVNAALNAVIFILFMLPLMFTRDDFKSRVQ